MWKITIFSQPRGGQKRHFFAQFFFLRILILITGRCIWGGLFEFFENLWWKMINSSAQWHIKVFLEFKLFWILNFFGLNHSYGYLGVYFMAPRVHWQNAKKWEWFFSRGVMCGKLPFFLSFRGSQKRHYFAQFFFPRISICDHRLVHLGWFIWVFWEFMMKKW